MSKPLYGCSNPSCAEEVSYPADMLRVYEGKPYCDCCWDDAPLAYAPGVDPDDEDAEPLYWHDLEPFVPEHEKRIAELEAACEKAEYELDWHSDELRTLEAEDARLRDGMQNILLHTLRNGNYTYDVQLANDLLGSIERIVKALLGGGE